MATGIRRIPAGMIATCYGIAGLRKGKGAGTSDSSGYAGNQYGFFGHNNLRFRCDTRVSYFYFGIVLCYGMNTIIIHDVRITRKKNEQSSALRGRRESVILKRGREGGEE